MDSAAIAADAIMDAPTEYRALPTFWSDQFDLKLQSAGLNKDADEIVVRGDVQDGPFSAIYLKEGRIISIDAINSPKDFMGARSLIVRGAVPDRTQLADVSLPLKKVACQEAAQPV